MKIIPVPTDEDNLLVALGITDTRADELKEILNETQKGTRDIVAHMVKVTELVSDDNEMAFCLFQLGAHAAMTQRPRFGLDELREMMAEGKNDSLKDKLD